MEKRNLGLLLLIIILGTALRFVALTWNPPSLNWDEVSHGYNAYSILKTGMDQWGQKFPLLNFRAYGDYPTTLNLYLTIPFLVVFGLTEFAIRFPHALLGVFTIISVYFLALGVTRKQNISLLSAFLVAVGPWYVFTSRFVLQSNLSVFLLITSAAFFVNRDKNRNNLILSFIMLFLTLFSYHTTRIFSPLILFLTAMIFKNEIKYKFVYIFIILYLIFAAVILVNPTARVRGNVLFILDNGAVAKIESQRNSSKLPFIIKKTIYNRPVYFIEQFTFKYFSYLSPRFLFFSGGTQYQFSLPGSGLLFITALPFFYLGLLLLFMKSVKDKNFKFLLIWLLLSPIPASLTNESYTVIRATTMLPLTEILTAIGFFWFLHKVPKKLYQTVLLVFIVSLIILAENYYSAYFKEYRNDYSWSWQYGYKEAVGFVSTNYNNYDKIIVTKKYGEPHEYFLFFLKYDPLKFLSDASKISYFKSNWWWVDHFDKFWFVNDWQIRLNPLDISSIQMRFITESKQEIDCTQTRCLLITSPGNYPPGWIRIKTINFLDGKPAFEIYEN